MTNAEMAETLRGCAAILADVAEDSPDPRLQAVSAAVTACAEAAEEAWEAESA